MGRKLGTEVGVNSSFVALIPTESVSIAILWLLLPPKVGVNRHGLWENSSLSKAISSFLPSENLQNVWSPSHLAKNLRWQHAIIVLRILFSDLSSILDR